MKTQQKNTVKINVLNHNSKNQLILNNYPDENSGFFYFRVTWAILHKWLFQPKESQNTCLNTKKIRLYENCATQSFKK